MKIRIKTNKEQKPKSESINKPTADSSEYYAAEAALRSLMRRGDLFSKKEKEEDAKIEQASANLRRQKNKGKPDYDKNGFLTKYVGNFPTIENTLKRNENKK
jgi:hypothetical protein